MCGSSSTTRTLSLLVGARASASAAGMGAGGERGRGDRYGGVGRERQLDREGGTLTLLAREHDAAPVLLHNALADRKAKSGAFALCLGGEEWLEHLRGQFFGDTGPVFGHLDGYAVEPAARPHRDGTRTPGGGDGLCRIVDQIDEY